MNYNLAVLLTCHNRKTKTLACLRSLFEANLPTGISQMNVYLVDDGCTDHTAESVKEKFSPVNVIQGDGYLYWNGGMRLAWDTAAKSKVYDFYLWLNDDTLIDSDAIIELLDCYVEAKSHTTMQAVIVGTCRTNFESKIFSYGGRNELGPMIPNGKLQKCCYINGNLVLIPKEIFEIVGNLSSDFTHAIGDNDYGLRAIQSGFNCYISKKYIATCPSNGQAAWCNPKTPIIKRFKLLNSPTGFYIKEYIVFLKRHQRSKWLIGIIKVYLKVLFPTVYKFLSKI